MNWKKIGITAIIILAILLLTAGAFKGRKELLQKTSETDRYASINLQGPIRTGKMANTATINPEKVKELVKKAENEGVDSYLFKINSPGGTVVTSKKLGRIIEDIDKPVSCVMTEVAASGAYWAATECDRIFADSLTMTGSIGVTSAYLEFTGTLDEYGIDYINLTAGKYKDAGSPFKNITEEERQMLEEQLETVHQEFIDQVAEGRNLSRDHVEELATGRTFLGKVAKEKGLVDEIGAEREAVSYLENRSDKNLTEKEYSSEKELNILSMLATKVGQGIGTVFEEKISAKRFNSIEIR